MAFEDHYVNRYKKMSLSVDAYDVDMQSAFENGEILPSAVPRETLGMPEEQHDVLANQRVKFNQMRIDNPIMQINDDGTFDVIDKTTIAPKVEAKQVDKEGQPVQRNYNDLSYEEKTNVWKMSMLDGMREKRVSRTIIDPDQVFDPDTGMNMALKVVTEIGEGLIEGFENTARAASILAYDTFPPTDPIGQAYADILNSNAISTTDLRAGILPDVENAEGIGYGLLRGIAQFAPNFIAFNRALSGFSSLRTANMTRGFLAGMPSDALAFDSVDGNLHDLAISVGEVDIPGIGMVNFDNEYTQFMASSAQDTQAEGRFRNVVEGGLVGVAFDMAIRGAGKGFTAAQGSAYRKKFTELYVSTAKNPRDFRVEAANRLEAQGMDTLQEAYKAKAATTVEMHSGLPVKEHQSKAIKALSEIALSKLMKGEITDYDSWVKVARKINADIPETLKRQSGDGDKGVKGDKTPEMLKRQSGDGFQYDADDLKGKEISYEVYAEDTKEAFTVTADAGKTMKSLYDRKASISKLMDCLS